MNDNEMSVFDHIGELRKRLIYVVVFFLIVFVASLFFAEHLILYLQNAREAKELTMNAFRITDPIKIYMQFAFIIALVITSPFLLYQLWAFISPGLYEKERKVTLSYIPVSVILFLIGISFSYFILFPFVVKFMGGLAERLAINQVIGINEYFQFLLQLTLPFGFLFQLPVVIMFLTRLGIITPMFLSKSRKYAYFILLVVAGLITPPELISHMMVSVPLFGLYEVSIIVSKRAYRKVLKAEMEANNIG
ncbi:twin-arginine translocase subunit TatC [Fredinandcohnia quinoae]|uniref:Sec-independent protein translocase protein TatC n=1 Tax=Fredinandcohnia quinoae TaxID=2918902 RepID=A0AAW5E3F1_9BACI|nr:twin-arginine translocase subunit TatC [Fredinandcohnia sp. SECRCQ15]MCH1627451.1 twin-arginine translocase subunit TatC [Fredinandcohnia sp. SECRCQ15]